mmetsp:Transcript_53273/g.116675  ORF Transcript_53273/g.116675 Transcript_53273/m.116675 type:complete len:253 (-) Transcript_53273:1766-2524(-)
MGSLGRPGWHIGPSWQHLLPKLCQLARPGGRPIHFPKLLQPLLQGSRTTKASLLRDLACQAQCLLCPSSFEEGASSRNLSASARTAFFSEVLATRACTFETAVWHRLSMPRPARASSSHPGLECFEGLVRRLVQSVCQDCQPCSPVSWKAPTTPDCRDPPIQDAKVERSMKARWYRERLWLWSWSLSASAETSKWDEHRHRRRRARRLGGPPLRPHCGSFRTLPSEQVQPAPKGRRTRPSPLGSWRQSRRSR